MADTPGAWLEAVQQVIAAVRASDVTDLELANGTFAVRVRRDPSSTSRPTLASVDGDTQFHRVLAPFTGVFYRAPTPSGRPYVEAGEWVEADAVIGLVETMKIFNEVNADVSGRIARFVADSGQLVHAGDVLLLIEPGQRATAEPDVHL